MLAALRSGYRVLRLDAARVAREIGAAVDRVRVALGVWGMAISPHRAAEGWAGLGPLRVTINPIPQNIGALVVDGAGRLFSDGFSLAGGSDGSDGRAIVPNRDGCRLRLTRSRSDWHRPEHPDRAQEFFGGTGPSISDP